MTPARSPGARIGGKYRLLERLAAGGMGEVWRAQNEATRAEVAVKLALPGIGDDAARRLAQEARAGAMLAHPNAVRVYDLLEEADGTHCLVMELLRGPTLERHLRDRGPLDAGDALAIVLPVTAALARAHDVGIVHRDVTPSNVVLAIDPDGRVVPKIVDFGVAKLQEGDVRTIAGQALGTPRYMAPERIRGREIDGRADLFSLAAVLYEAMTGVSPFAAPSPEASLALVLEAVVDPDPRIDPALWLEIRRALAKQPYERHRDAREFAHALREASGISASGLEERLARVQPIAPAAPTVEVAGVAEASASSTVALPATNRRWVAAALALAASGAVAASLAFRGAAARSAPAETRPNAAAETRAETRAETGPTVAEALRPIAPPPSAAADPAPSKDTAAAAVALDAGAPHPRIARPARPKQVATTPGF